MWLKQILYITHESSINVYSGIACLLQQGCDSTYSLLNCEYSYMAVVCPFKTASVITWPYELSLKRLVEQKFSENFQLNRNSYQMHFDIPLQYFFANKVNPKHCTLIYTRFYFLELLIKFILDLGMSNILSLHIVNQNSLNKKINK